MHISLLCLGYKAFTHLELYLLRKATVHIYIIISYLCWGRQLCTHFPLLYMLMEDYENTFLSFVYFVKDNYTNSSLFSLSLSLSLSLSFLRGSYTGFLINVEGGQLLHILSVCLTYRTDHSVIAHWSNKLEVALGFTNTLLPLDFGMGAHRTNLISLL